MGMPESSAKSVAALMRRHVVTVGPGESVLEADRIMRLGRLRHLPVVQNGSLVGVLSHRDVVEASIATLEEVSPEERIEHLRRTPIERLLCDRRPRTVEADCSLRAAALTMLRLKIGCLPVVKPGPEGLQLVGILTESDLLRAAYVPDFAGASD